MSTPIELYNIKQKIEEEAICSLLYAHIQQHLPHAESKIWHGAPVWFSEGNPIVGYDVLKNCVRLLFWSGQTFDEPGLKAEGKFKAAEARYTNTSQININDLSRWLQKSEKIQWDYKNIVQKRGLLERLK